LRWLLPELTGVAESHDTDSLGAVLRSALVCVAPRITKGVFMHGESYYTPVRIVSFVVLIAMLSAVLYAVWISFTHWSGIGV
jgi:hypothetical protein